MNAHIDFESIGIGFGTSPLQGEEAASAVAAAIEAGYTLIDTASRYENEEAVGKGIRDSGIARDDVIIQTKLRGNDHDNVRAALELSLAKLKVDYVDVWMVHWPLPMLGLYAQAYEEMAKLQLATSIFTITACRAAFCTRRAASGFVISSVSASFWIAERK